MKLVSSARREGLNLVFLSRDQLISSPLDLRAAELTLPEATGLFVLMMAFLLLYVPFWMQHRFDRVVNRPKARDSPCVPSHVRCEQSPDIHKRTVHRHVGFSKGPNGWLLFRRQFARDTNGRHVQYHPEPTRSVGVLMLSWYHGRSTDTRMLE